MQAQYFFDDPAMDGVFNVVFALAAELQITRCRTRALEKLLVARGVIGADAIERWKPDVEEDAARLADLDRLVTTLFDACKSSISERRPA